jgi:serine/threonine-protein kinase SRPK3
VTVIEALQDSCNAFVPALLDEFIHDGPNGSHICIVTNLLGPSLQHVITDYPDGGDRLEPDDILRLSGQLLEATALLHEAGFAHGGMHPPSR